MSQIKRSSLVRGPAQIEYNGLQLLAATKTDATFDLAFKGVPSAFAGDLAQIRTGRKGSISLDLVGSLLDFDLIFPYRDPSVFPIGKSIIPDPDQPLIVRPLDATQPQIRYYSAGIRKMTGCKFSATDPLFSGQMEFGIYPKDDTDDADPNLLYVEEDNEIGTVGIAYDPADLIITPYVLSWLSAGTTAFHWGADATSGLPFYVSAGSLQTALNAGSAMTAAGGIDVTGGDYVNGYIARFRTNGSRTAITGVIAGNVPPGLALVQTVITAGDSSTRQKVKLQLTPWANFTHEAGVTADFGITTKAQQNNALGDVDEYLTAVTASVECTPQGPSEQDIRAALNLQGPNSRLGLVAGQQNDLNVIGSGVYMRLFRAILTSGPQSYGAETPRIGPCKWIATRSAASGGVLNPLFDISTTPLTYP